MRHLPAVVWLLLWTATASAASITITPVSPQPTCPSTPGAAVASVSASGLPAGVTTLDWILSGNTADYKLASPTISSVNVVVGNSGLSCAPTAYTISLKQPSGGGVVATATSGGGGGPSPPAQASTVGFTTLALDSEFSQAQPSGWFACIGGPSGATWYQGRQGGDTGVPACSVTGGQPGPPSTSRFNLVTDPSTGKQVFDLTMKMTDVDDNGPAIHYATIQTADDSENAANGSVPCCVFGEQFPYGFYMETRYRIITVPDHPSGATGGTWTAFWQFGSGLSPFTNPHGTTMEIDHPEQHGELWYTPGSSFAGTGLDWGAINWYDGSGGPYFSNVVPDWINIDARQYHVFGVRVTTDGKTGIAYCSYLDGVQRGCATGVVNNSAQYGEQKIPIVFFGLACYTPGSPLTVSCTNVPITGWYACGSPVGSLTCFSSNGQTLGRNNDNDLRAITGVSGCPSCNNSWFLTRFTNGSGGSDYYIRADYLNTTNYPTWPGGSPTGGTVNALSQIDGYIDYVRVWTCAGWATGPCHTSLDTGTP